MPNTWTQFVAACRVATVRKTGTNPRTALPSGSPHGDFIHRCASANPLLHEGGGAGPPLWALPEVARSDWVRRFGIPTRAYLDGLPPLFRFKEVVRFVGDLDPADLAIFRTLQTGSTNLIQRRGWPLSVHYAGVDSEWMTLAERVKGTSVQRLRIRMAPVERAQYRALRETWPGLRETVGDRAADLLTPDTSWRWKAARFRRSMTSRSVGA